MRLAIVEQGTLVRPVKMAVHRVRVFSSNRLLDWKITMSRSRSTVSVLFASLLVWGGVHANPVQFNDVSEQLQLGGGVETWGFAWGDVNGDNWPDLFSQGHRDFPRLYRNNGDGTFSDIAYEVDPNRKWINFTIDDKHGATFTDVDNDGDDDIYISVSATGDAQLLISTLNEPNGGLQDIASAAGVASDATARMGVFFDLNTNGLLDLHNHTSGNSNLYEQQSGLSFSATTPTCGTRTEYGQLFDADSDGDLDYLCGIQGIIPNGLFDTSTGSFVNNNAAMPQVTLANDTIPGDFNNDLLTDLVVTRGGLRPSGASRTNSTGIDGWFRSSVGAGFTFTSVGDITVTLDGAGIGLFDDPIVLNLSPNGQTSGAGYGVSVSRSNGEWVVEHTSNSQAYVRVRSTAAVSDPVMFGLTNQDRSEETEHLVNGVNGLERRFNTGLFEEMDCISGVAADLDNDMDLDLYLACRQGAENLENRYYDNQGDGTFVRVFNHGGEGPVGTGLELGVADSVVAADYDVDGFIDLAVANGLLFYPVSRGGPDTLLKNAGNSNNWIQIDLRGTNSNRNGIGAKVYATAGGKTQLREQNGGYHRWSQNLQRIHFGMAGNAVVTEIRIEWPNGQVDVHQNVAVNQLYEAFEGGALTTATLGPVLKTEFNPGDECGQPLYQNTYGPAVLVWRECGTDSWRMRIRGGLDVINDFQTRISTGSIQGDQPFSGVNGVMLDGADLLTNSPAELINFNIAVSETAGNNKGVNFSTQGLVSACLDFSHPAIETVIVGAKGKRVYPPFDILRGDVCDADGDGILDANDPDDDNDGVLDVDDAFPFDPNESVDTDGDGVGDNADRFPNDPSESSDQDNDGIGDNADTDSDNDGMSDATEDGFGGSASVMLDDFEVDLGWTADPNSSDTATTGIWGVSNPEQTASSGGSVMQLNNTVSGSQALVTDGRAGASVGNWDVDGGVTSTLSPVYRLPASVQSLSLFYYFAHLGNANADDFFRISLIGASQQVLLLEERGDGTTREAQWTPVSFNVSAFAGQDVQLLVEIADAANGSLVEGAIDDIALETLLSDVDGDLLMPRFDLDSDNDGIADVIEAGLTDANNDWVVDNLALQGTVVTPPDSDNDGLPDFLDLESNNPSNNGTAYDIANSGFANRDTNGDGRITAADVGGGVDADGDGIDDLIDPDPNSFGGVPATNGAPVANSFTVATTQDSPVNVNLSGSDPDFDPISFAVSSGPANGSLTGTGASLVYTPNTGFTGSDSFVYRAFDGVLFSAPATVSITVSPASAGIFCGEPNFSAATEQATFIWKDCATGEYFLRVTGGGSTAGVRYQAEIAVAGGLTSFTPVLIEGNDVLDDTVINLFTYEMRVFGNGVDGIDFTVPANACFTQLDSNALPVLLGAQKTPISGPNLDLTTGTDCAPGLDSDNDGLTDLEEAALGTNPMLADTDGGGVNDGDEVMNGTNPLLASDDIDPAVQACGEPVFAGAVDQGVFVWKECGTGSTDTAWRVRVSAGGQAFDSYVGEVTSDIALTAAGFSLEGSDVLDSVAGDPTIDFELKVGGSGVDGFDFALPAGRDACFDPQSLPAGAQVMLGVNRVNKSGPFQLSDLSACDVDLACGQPTYDRQTDPGVYLWKNCSAQGSGAQWEVRVVGGGLPWAGNSATITGSGPLTAQGTDIEGNDTLDTTPGDNMIDFTLFVGGSGEDGFSTVIPAGSSCFTPVALPAGVQVFVGASKVLKTGAFNLTDLGVCN